MCSTGTPPKGRQQELHPSSKKNKTSHSLVAARESDQRQQQHKKMATPRVASPVQPSFHNGPNDPPVLFQPIRTPSHMGIGHHHQDEEEQECCRACLSTAMIVDWKQGDRICTNCGVVADERLRDDRAEWKDFNEAEDLVKNRQNVARCGLVKVDETKYLGGLQPTRLSSQAYGSSTVGGYDTAVIRKRLITTNRRLDHMMEQIHAQKLHEARMDRTLKRKRQARTATATARAQRDDDSVMDGGDNDNLSNPDSEQLLLQEEEETHRLQAALHAEKWSLSRAIKIHGQSHEQMTEQQDDNEDRDQLLARMDKSLRKASHQLYLSYSMIIDGAKELHLPERVINETTNRMVRYITRRDGFSVPGISSRLSKSQGATDPKIRKKANEVLRECNQRRQVAALSAAFVFLTARNMGWARSIKDVCATFQPAFDEQSTVTLPPQILIIKPKHCNKAITEIRSVFPEYIRSTQMMMSSVDSVAGTMDQSASTSEIDSIANLAAHSTQKLQLPPVAEASVQTLLAFCRSEQIQTGQHSGTKLSILCASIIYFVSMTGSVMQRLARQTQNDSTNLAAPSENSSNNNTNESDQDSSDNDNDDDPEKPFDVFSCPAIPTNSSDTKTYELRRMWDAWAEQIAWSRNESEIEQTCGVSRNVFMDFYKTKLYPRRLELLNVLKSAVDGNRTSASSACTSCDNVAPNSTAPSQVTNFLNDSPMASTLLQRIDYAGPLKW